MSCPIAAEGQEHVCRACGLRWDFDEVDPPCPDTLPAYRQPDPTGADNTAATREEAEAVAGRAKALAARVRLALAMQTKHANPVAIELTPALVRDVIAELERPA